MVDCGEGPGGGAGAQEGYVCDLDLDLDVDLLASALSPPHLPPSPPTFLVLVCSSSTSCMAVRSSCTSGQ